MAAAINVLSIESIDSSSCITISTENNRYLFDVSEGTQRLCIEHKIKLIKLDYIFITSISTNCICGLPGLLITAYDTGKKSINILGPIGLKDYINSISRYININVNIIELNDVNNYQLVNCFDLIVESFYINGSIIYICQTLGVLGKFNVNKAIELGIPKGPAFGQLKSGKPYTLSNGTIVLPEQVVGSPEKGKYFSVIGKLNETSITLLHSHYLFTKFTNNSETIECLIHLSDYNIINTYHYQEFMHSFTNKSTHILLSKYLSQPISSFYASTLYTRKLHSVCPNAFPYMSLSIDSTYKYESIYPSEYLSDRIVRGQPLIKYQLVPSKSSGIDISNCLSQQNIENEIKEFESNVVKISKPIDSEPLNDNKIWFLGTACAIPSKVRNVSGILIEVKSTRSYILLDAGEGSWNQIVRLVYQSIDRVIDSQIERQVNIDICLKLKMVWISHHHADHHLGLLTIISNRMKTLSHLTTDSYSPLLVIAPYNVLNYLSTYPDIRDGYIGVNSYYLDPNENFHQFGVNIPINELIDTLTNQQLIESIWIDIGISSIANIKVIHCNNSYAIKLSIDSISLVYSGDTRPCNELINFGRNADILIHEATFDDLLVNEAIDRNHSTISEAVSVGRQMNARSIILTHFSQRYSNILNSDLMNQLVDHVIYAFDYMTISFHDIVTSNVDMNKLIQVFNENIAIDDPIAVDCIDCNKTEVSIECNTNNKAVRKRNREETIN